MTEELEQLLKNLRLPEIADTLDEKIQLAA